MAGGALNNFFSSGSVDKKVKMEKSYPANNNQTVMQQFFAKFENSKPSARV